MRGSWAASFLYGSMREQPPWFEWFVERTLRQA
jgi:hypothetical protein